jgi:hypothetical protein
LQADAGFVAGGIDGFLSGDFSFRSAGHDSFLLLFVVVPYDS